MTVVKDKGLNQYAAWVFALLLVCSTTSTAQDTVSSLGKTWSVAVSTFSESSPRGIGVDQTGVVRTFYDPKPSQCAQLDAAELKVIADLISEVDLPPLELRQDWTKPQDGSVLNLTVTVPARLRTTSVSTTNYVLQLTPPGAESPTGLHAAAERLTRKVWDLRKITSEAACSSGAPLSR